MMDKADTTPKLNILLPAHTVLSTTGTSSYLYNFDDVPGTDHIWIKFHMSLAGCQGNRCLQNARHRTEFSFNLMDTR